MIQMLRDSLWSQFGATIDMLKNAIVAWPEEKMNNNKKFFAIAYHTVIFFDYYLTFPPSGFSSALPFSVAEPQQLSRDAIDDLVPDRIYTKAELLDYLERSREKASIIISSLTEATLQNRFVEESDAKNPMNYSLFEILLYNMRHVQHHAAQLNLILRQAIDDSPDWIDRVETEKRTKY